MSGIEDFRQSIEGLISKSKAQCEKEEAQKKRSAEEFEKMLLKFDEHADVLQEKVIQPRMTYLASLFEHAPPPEAVEENEYRHRIHIHFNHTDEFPCTADVTFLIVHDEKPGHFNVKFEYLILPAYVTDKYKASETVRVAMGPDEHARVAEFAEASIKTFLMSYLKARRV